MEINDELYIQNLQQEEDICEDELNLLEDIEDSAEDSEEERVSFESQLYHLKLDYSNESLYALSDNLEVERGEHVVAETRYGVDLARVLGRINAPAGVKRESIVAIKRVASQEDLDRAEKNRSEEEHSLSVFREKIAAHNLEMKPVSAHFILDGSKILLFFSADTRVDFRNLVKDLSASLKVKKKGLERIELRQIGVRDEAKMLGGLGVCGRPFCCHAVTDRLKPVLIKMPKEQNLSINSLKISGPCARLLCCLAYEYEWYAEKRKTMPCSGSRVFYDGCMFRVIATNPITEQIRLIGEDDRIIEIPSTSMTHTDNGWKIIDS